MKKPSILILLLFLVLITWFFVWNKEYINMIEETTEETEIFDQKQQKEESIQVKKVWLFIPFSGEKADWWKAMQQVFIDEMKNFNENHPWYRLELLVNDSLLFTDDGTCDGEIEWEKHKLFSEEVDRAFFPSCSSDNLSIISQARIDMIRRILYDLFRFPLPEETYPWCDSANIEVGRLIISACNIWSSVAGIWEESIGTYLNINEAKNLCATGYHLPTADERSYIITYRNESNNHRGTYGSNNLTSWILDRSLEDVFKFQNDLKMPLLDKNEPYFTEYSSYLSSSINETNPNLSIFSLYFDKQKVEIRGNFYEGRYISARCFKDIEENYFK